MTKRTTSALVEEAERIREQQSTREDELRVRRQSMATILAQRRPELFRPYLFSRAIVLDGVAAVSSTGNPVRGFVGVTDLPTLELIDKALESLLDESPFDRGAVLSFFGICLLSWKETCSKELPCGGNCVLAPGHVVPCECDGDREGQPGTCPA